jgi:hypothetical protein
MKMMDFLRNHRPQGGEQTFNLCARQDGSQPSRINTCAQ